MVDEKEAQKSTENIKAFSRKKITVVTGLIVLLLTTVGFFSYQNGLFSNLFNRNSNENKITEGEKSNVEETQIENKTSMAAENVNPGPLAESENSKSKNN